MNHRIKKIIDNKEFWTFEDILPIDKCPLEMLIVGKVPTPKSVEIGHYFQGTQGKAMWNKLTEYSILNKTTLYHDDSLILNNIGITDIIKEPRETGEEPSLAEYLEGKERVDDIIKSYSPKVVFFVYKSALEQYLFPNVMLKMNYGFNDHLCPYFNGSRVFLFPMPGANKQNTNKAIERHMSELKDYLKR